MLALVLLAILFVLLFGGLGVLLHPLFFLGLLLLLVLALSGGYIGTHRHH